MSLEKYKIVKVFCSSIILLFSSSFLYPQVLLTAQKIGADVQLLWLNGSGSYDVIRSTSPTMTANTSVLAEATNATSYLDSGAASSSTILYYYIIADVANKPLLNITSPCDTPPGGPLCNFETNNRKEDVSGSFSGAVQIYVNDVLANIAANNFTAAGIPLNLGQNLITASAKSGSDWAIDQIIITRNNANQAPEIIISSPADGTTIYDPTPLVIVDYADPEGNLNLGTLHIYINGTDRTSSFVIGANQATYQIPQLEALSAGQNFIYASIQDMQGYSMNASSQFIVSNPIITSLSPTAGSIGSSVIINGNGFDPNSINDLVRFGNIQATVTAASSNQLTDTL